MRRAEAEGTTVRAVGAGHSWSDAALTDGYLVLPDRLGGIVDVDGRLVRVLGGTHLRDLNAALDARGLALPQMGGYDEQTIAGVVSTSTHGSGLNWGPFPDFVRSLELVVAGGEVVNIERDDPRFDAAVCGMGTLGLIHSLVIEVREKFWLHEVRTVDTWERVRETVTPAGVLGEGDHYELFVNPYAGKDGEHRLVVTRRSDCPEPAGEPKDKLERHPLTELESKLPITGVLLRFAARHWPALLAWRFDAVLADMADDAYDNVSYKVFNIGEANRLPAVSMELGVTLEGDRHLETVDRILAIAARRRKEEKLVHTSPIALRFVAPSKAYASMMYDRPTMMIELILAKGTKNGFDLLATYERELWDLGIRPHWGQVNSLSAASDFATLYPKWPQWLAVYEQFNVSGVFNSQFTDRIGISQ